MKLATLRLLTKATNPKGDIYHFIQKSDPEYSGFGEVYFSSIKKGITKGWKLHTRMTCNLTVITGSVEFNLHSEGIYETVCIGSPTHLSYQRAILSIPPNIWFAFTGLDDSMIVNFANIPHDPLESKNQVLNSFPPFRQ